MQCATKRKRPDPPSPSASHSRPDTTPPSTNDTSDMAPPSTHDSPSTRVAEAFERLDMAPSRKRNLVQTAGPPGVYHSTLSSPAKSSRFVLNPPRRVTSPPPPTPVASPHIEQDQPLALPQAIKIAQEKLSALRCDSPSTSTQALSPYQPPPSSEPDAHNPDENMTWQDSEITGREIDSAADDDGEGINGIGFIPTPAIVNKRSEWRRRQIQEWRARESKEARQTRYDKRKATHRDSAIALDDGGALKRRMVRFAEA